LGLQLRVLLWLIHVLDVLLHVIMLSTTGHLVLSLIWVEAVDIAGDLELLLGDWILSLVVVEAFITVTVRFHSCNFNFLFIKFDVDYLFQDFKKYDHLIDSAMPNLARVWINQIRIFNLTMKKFT
jgi:hypothetical protein